MDLAYSLNGSEGVRENFENRPNSGLSRGLSSQHPGLNTVRLLLPYRPPYKRTFGFFYVHLIPLREHQVLRETFMSQ